MSEWTHEYLRRSHPDRKEKPPVDVEMQDAVDREGAKVIPPIHTFSTPRTLL